nr:MAG TPA: hypothetical protein [Caudoviricetes sp.]
MTLATEFSPTSFSLHLLIGIIGEPLGYLPQATAHICTLTDPK